MEEGPETGEGGALPARLLFVADIALLTETVCDCLAQHERIESCDAVPTIEDATAFLADHDCDVVVVDLMMAERSAIDGVRAIRQARPDVRIVALTGHAELDLLTEAVDANVDAFAAVGSSLDDLVSVAHDDHADHPASAELLARVTAEIQRREEARGDGPPIDLTPRERQVLALLASGMPVKDIARRLDVQVETCRGYVKSLLGKLGARSQLQAVVAAARYGLLPPLGEAPTRVSAG
jgi:DNA-binding NarL/FixJ family response regulator